ncbi:MAG TPA: condensation domain-containing protein, partial [Ktedonobacteraceae bacterium]
MILEDAQVSTALISSPVLSLLEHRFAQNPLLQKLSYIVSDTLSDELVSSWKAYKASGESLALLQYTSGSTGNPKGVMITHNNLIYNMIFLQDVLKPSIERPMVSWLPPYHDMGLGKILGSCYQGVPAVLMSPAAFLQQPLRWLQAISHYQAEISSAPNFAFELCTQKASPEMLETLDLSTWTLALTGAEPIRHETLERFACTFAPCGFRKEAFYPCYGLAEATLFVTGGSKTDPPHIRSFSISELERGRAVVVGGEQTPLRQLVGCGRQIAGQQLLIVDPETRIRCSPGQIGEIWVSGPNVALGYWQRPQETAETFQGYLRDSNEGPFLRTGDLGFLDGSDDGELFVTGRIKDVIIIRGRNLYPQDIEAVAEQSHPVLRQGNCAAFSIPLAATEGLVIVQEVERSFQQWDKQEVVQALRRAVTTAFDIEVHAIALIRVGSIFKTSSGKIQRQACKQAFLSQSLQTLYFWVHEEPQAALLSSSLSDKQTTHVRAADEKENRTISPPIFSFQEILARLKASIAAFCQLDPGGIDQGASLAHYGLDSLTAIRLSHDVSQYLEHQLSPTIIYEHSSIEELARAIAEEMVQKVGRDAIISPVELISREKELSLSFAQERLWFLDQISSHDTSYNIPVAFRLSGLLHVDKLERSLTLITQRHEVLRTIFSLTQDGRPAQIILPALPVSIPLIDLRGSQQMKHDLVQRLIRQEIARPFDLTCGPLLRVFLFRADKQEHVLLCTMHHIVTDGWSMGVLMRELSACYQACLEGTSPRLPDLPFHYADYAYWQRTWLQKEVLQSQLTYWRQQLAGAPAVLNLPLDHPRPAVQTFAGAQQDMLLPAVLLQELKALSQREGVTLFMTLLAAFQVLLLRYTGQDDLVVGTPIANRTRQELEGLIGFFVNTLVLRTDLSGHPTFEQVLQRVREVCLGAYAHQDIPFEKVVEELEPERDLSHSALFQVMLILQNTPREQGELAGVRLTPLAIESITSKFDLTLTLIEMEAGLQCSLEYSTELFEV